MFITLSNPNARLHHICYEVDNLETFRNKLQAKDARILRDGSVKVTAHGKPVSFLQPDDFNATLIKLEQV